MYIHIFSTFILMSEGAFHGIPCPYINIDLINEYNLNNMYGT